MVNNMNFNVMNREQIINRIIHLVDILGIKNLFGWKDINFNKITSIRNDKDLMTEELVVLLEELEDILNQRGIDGNAIYLNPDFEDGNENVNHNEKVNHNENNDKDIENWRNSINCGYKSHSLENIPT